MNHAACYRAIQARDVRFDGRFYTAVRTTGIYCRPVCPARTPLARNVEFYPSAAAAQAAGFRPCLRCRPERAPSAAEVGGRPALLQRALALIDRGWLDEGSVTGLASHLDISERQLRRLFDSELGAAPVQMAQSRRLLLAKQLIQDSHLPITDIAYAAGFGSLRRFNEVFLQAHGVAPSAWRRSLPAEREPDSATGLPLRLYFRPPLDWSRLLDFFRARAITGLEHDDGRTLWRVLDLDGASATVAIRPGGDDHLRVQARLSSLTALPRLLARLRQVFDLGADCQTIGAALATDPDLPGLHFRGTPLAPRVPGGWGGFELTTRALLGQQVSITAARRLVQLLFDRLGEPLSADLLDGWPATIQAHLRARFPSAERVAEADLSFLPMPGARQRALQSLAVAVASDPMLLQPAGSLQASLDKLLAIPGIGPWTAQYIALRELRETDAFPASDAGLLRSWAQINGQRPTPKALSERAEVWRPWRAYAVQQLWNVDPAMQPDRRAQGIGP
ncbi:MAG: Ada metal-binding domain-containing protein [Lysobacterales bacterium]